MSNLLKYLGFFFTRFFPKFMSATDLDPVYLYWKTHRLCMNRAVSKPYEQTQQTLQLSCIWCKTKKTAFQSTRRIPWSPAGDKHYKRAKTWSPHGVWLLQQSDMFSRPLMNVIVLCCSAAFTLFKASSTSPRDRLSLLFKPNTKFTSSDEKIQSGVVFLDATPHTAYLNLALCLSLFERCKSYWEVTRQISWNKPALLFLARLWASAAAGGEHSLLPEEASRDGLHHLRQRGLARGSHDALHAGQDRVSPELRPHALSETRRQVPLQSPQLHNYCDCISTN